MLIEMWVASAAHIFLLRGWHLLVAWRRNAKCEEGYVLNILGKVVAVS